MPNYDDATEYPKTKTVFEYDESELILRVQIFTKVKSNVFASHPYKFPIDGKILQSFMSDMRKTFHAAMSEQIKNL